MRNQRTGGEGTSEGPGAGRVRNATAELRENARRLRRERTPAEERLWATLRGQQLGVKFRRQYAVETFVLDFYCPAARLVLEVDGAIHDTASVRKHDAARDAYLTARGCRVLRLRNEEVLTDLPGTLRRIVEALQEAMSAGTRETEEMEG